MRNFIHQEVVKALVNSRLPYDHAIGEVLENEAEIVGEKACVRVIDESGGWVMLEDRIEQWKADPRFRDCVPNPTRVSKGDVSGLCDCFDQIASGTTVVE
jgi:hypothetical protein